MRALVRFPGPSLRRATRFALTATLAFSLLLPSLSASAETFCAPLAGAAPTLAGFTADQRLEAIQFALHRGARRANKWSWTWRGLYAAAVVGQLASLGFRSPDSQRDVAVGAPGALLGVTVLTLMPLRVIEDHRELDTLMLEYPEGDRCAVLARAEQLLVRDAASETFGQSPLVHYGNLAINAGFGLALGFAFHHWVAGAVTAGVGFTVGELQIFTQPTDVVEFLDRYRQGALDLAAASTKRSWALTPAIAPGNYTLRLGLAF